MASVENITLADPSPEPPTQSRTRRLVLAAAGLGALLFLGLYLAAFAAAGGGVPRGTTVWGVDLGGLSPAAAEQRLDGEGAQRSGRTVTVLADLQEFPVTLGQAGLTVDAAATVDKAGSRSLNPARLIPALFGVRRQVEPVVETDTAKLTQAAQQLSGRIDQPAREGTLTFDDGTVKAVQPQNGRSLDVKGTEYALQQAFLAGDTRIRVPVAVKSPLVTGAEVQRALTEFGVPAMSGPVTLDMGDKQFEATPELIGTYLTMAPDSARRLVPKLDAAGLISGLEKELEGFGTKARDASFEFRGGRPVLVPSAEGREVDPDQLSTGLLAALPSRTDREVTLTTKVTQPDLTTEEAEGLGIEEQLSTFTTRYPIAAYRVQNIGRAAALIDGSLILPGETWSLNRTVGQRTPANGFTSGYIIKDGTFVEELGGGTSQAATTTFNAAFFAGLDDAEHHPHSLYISRYPAGREATVAWGAKDLRFRNDTGNGVLIHAVHKRGSITVSMWGTKKYDEIRSVSSKRYNHKEAGTRYSYDSKCEPIEPVAGFEIDVWRVFVDNGVEVKREKFHTKYQPTDRVICRKPGERSSTSNSTPSPTPTPVPTD